MKGTPFDFTEFHEIGERIGDAPGGGYDHNYVLHGHSSALKLAATVDHLPAGRRMELFTTALGMQFYSGNFLDASFVGWC